MQVIFFHNFFLKKFKVWSFLVIENQAEIQLFLNSSIQFYGCYSLKKVLVLFNQFQNFNVSSSLNFEKPLVFYNNILMEMLQYFYDVVEELSLLQIKDVSFHAPYGVAFSQAVIFEANICKLLMIENLSLSSINIAENHYGVLFQGSFILNNNEIDQDACFYHFCYI